MGTALGIGAFFTGLGQAYADSRNRKHQEDMEQEQNRIQYVGKLIADPSLTPQARQQVEADFMKMLGGKDKKGWEQAFKHIQTMVDSGTTPAQGVPLQQTAGAGQQGQRPLPAGADVSNLTGVPNSPDATRPRTATAAGTLAANPQLTAQPIHMTDAQQGQQEGLREAARLKEMLPVQEAEKKFEVDLQMARDRAKHTDTMQKVYAQAGIKREQMEEGADLKAGAKIRELQQEFPDATPDQITHLAQQKAMDDHLKAVTTIDKMRHDMANSDARLDVMRQRVALYAKAIESGDTRALGVQIGANERAQMKAQADPIQKRIDDNLKHLTKLRESVDAAEHAHEGKNVLARWLEGAPNVQALEGDIETTNQQLKEDTARLAKVYGIKGAPDPDGDTGDDDDATPAAPGQKTSTPKQKRTATPNSKDPMKLY
jgi:hypothetical protein